MYKYQGGEKSVQIRISHAYDNKFLVDAILSKGLIDIWFAPFPGTAMSSKKTAYFFLSPSPRPSWKTRTTDIK